MTIARSCHSSLVSTRSSYMGKPHRLAQLALRAAPRFFRQLENSSPTIRHLICVGSPIFRCFKELHSGWVTRNADPSYIALRAIGLQDLSQVLAQKGLAATSLPPLGFGEAVRSEASTWT
jgi:hypothetical protein